MLLHETHFITKKLTITQRPRADSETVLMHTDNFRPDITLF